MDQRRTMPCVIACALTPRHRARLSDALRAHARLVFIDTLDELIPRLRASTEAVNVIIVPSYDVDRPLLELSIRQIAMERPWAAIVAYCSPDARFAADLRALAAAGVHQFVLVDVNDEGVVLRDVLARASHQCAAEWLMRQLEPLIPSSMRPIAQAVLSHPRDITDMESLTQGLNVRRRTLYNWCLRAKFLPPAELLAWCRLFLVAYMLSSTKCTIETIALELSYPSATTLRNTVQRYVGLTATQMRDRGAVNAVLAALRQRLAQPPE